MTPLIKPRIYWTGYWWRCFCLGPGRSNSGWADTPLRAYEDWVRKLHLDGLYWEFFV